MVDARQQGKFRLSLNGQLGEAHMIAHLKRQEYRQTHHHGRDK